MLVDIIVSTNIPHRWQRATPTWTWSDHQEQFEVQCLTQSHSDMWTGGGGDRTTDPVVSSLPPEPQPPEYETELTCEMSLNAAFVVTLKEVNTLLLLQKSNQQVQRDWENVCSVISVCVCYTPCFLVCVCCVSCSVSVRFVVSVCLSCLLSVSVCLTVCVSECVPAALHPCRHANSLTASHSLFPKKEAPSRWQFHDAPLPSRC